MIIPEKLRRARKSEFMEMKPVKIGHSYDISDEKYIEQVVKYLREENRRQTGSLRNDDKNSFVITELKL